MFARRKRIPIIARVRDFFWPRIGFLRSSRYVGHRLARLPGTPYAIAGGFAWGAAVSFTPFVGLHFILSGICAYFTRASIIASAIGTVVGNPWTFPFIWALVYNMGATILALDSSQGAPPMETLAGFFSELWGLAGQWLQFVFGLREFAQISGAASDRLWEFATSVFWPMLVGSLPALIVVWIIFYLPLKYLIGHYQSARRHRMAWRRDKLTGSPADPVTAPVEKVAVMEVSGKEVSVKEVSVKEVSVKEGEKDDAASSTPRR